MNLNHTRAKHRPTTSTDPLTLTLNEVNADMLPLVGGKAANLGELHRAGLSIPEGFCITTTAYERVSFQTGLESILSELATADPEDTQRLARYAASARTAFSSAVVPQDILKAISEAYSQLGAGEPLAVAVRSSATAEDLPFASFAGQQESYLNIVGIEALLDAVRRCWASLWTERAVSYRSSQGMDHRMVRMAIVVQQMIEAQVSGVLFTANPLSGHRRQAVINASFGLGEAIVSGAINPDHFVVDTDTLEIVDRLPGDKQFLIRGALKGGTERIPLAGESREFSLTDAQAVDLAKLGMQVEEHFGAPQDIEWAIDREDHIWLTQSRPITTLFPLPADAPASHDDLRAYLSFTVQQGTHRPFTPMGISAIRLLASSITTLLGSAPADPLEGPHFVTETASRVFIDVTSALLSSFGRSILIDLMAQAETRAAAILSQLAADRRFSLRPGSRVAIILTIGRLFVLTGAPWHLVRALVAPETAHKRMLKMEQAIQMVGNIDPDASAASHLAAVEKLLFGMIPRLLSATFPVMVGGLTTVQLAGRLLGQQATANKLQAVVRGAPFNPTTEMGLSLWTLAQSVRSDPEMATLVRGASSGQLADRYLRKDLPLPLQNGAAEFLNKYGHRSVNELDMGMTRWSEDPAYIFGTLISYLELDAAAQSPVVEYQRAGQRAEAIIAELIDRARQQSRLRGLLVGFVLRRARALAGLREMPRYCIALMLARSRKLLRRVGEELAMAGVLDKAEDIFFITFPEAHAALSGADLRAIANTRRKVYERELTRRHVPSILLSDGTEPSIEQTQAAADHKTLQGTPASPGIMTATAHVILDPQNARLSQGEILVAPSTDPGWTPLFLIAGGLVMETGGEVSHGAIVARECGIPAVVGVAGATERIQTGQRITVDGSTGIIRIDGDAK